MAARSNAQVCGRSLDGVVGSNPAGRDRCLSVVSVVCGHAEVCATGRSLVQGSPTECVRVVECKQVQQ